MLLVKSILEKKREYNIYISEDVGTVSVSNSINVGLGLDAMSMG